MNKVQLVKILQYPYKSWIEKFPDYKVSVGLSKSKKLSEKHIKKYNIKKTWKYILNNITNKEEYNDINEYLSTCLKKTNGEINIFPYPNAVFKAFDLTPFDEVKVVVLGQDPYFNHELHNNKNIPQAMGLSFSVPEGIKIPPSLNNIYKNLITYNHLIDKPTSGDLTFWCLQGCLMLNASLTVQHKHAGSHMGYWKKITDNIIKYISDKRENVVFVLWGGFAAKKKSLIDSNKHKVIISSHPSGFSCYKPFGSYPAFNDFDHFGEINKYLTKLKKKPIIWQL